MSHVMRPNKKSYCGETINGFYFVDAKHALNNRSAIEPCNKCLKIIKSEDKKCNTH